MLLVLTVSDSQSLTFARSKGSIKMRMSASSARMDGPFTASQLNPSLFSTGDFFFFYVEKVPAQVISTEEGIVCTHGRRFYHRSPCKPVYTAFWRHLSYDTAAKCHAQENDRDFRVPFKMSVTK